MAECQGLRAPPQEHLHTSGFRQWPRETGIVSCLGNLPV